MKKKIECNIINIYQNANDSELIKYFKNYSIIEKKQIRIAEKFRYTFLTDLVERDVVLFSQVSVCVKNSQ